MISIDREKCTRCGICLEVCPNYVLARDRSEGTEEDDVFVRYPHQCCACGHCAALCPSDAVEHTGLPEEAFQDLPDPGIPPETMRTLLRTRRSIRVYKEDPVPKELLDELIDVGIHAGTSSNGQTEGFIVIRDRDVLADVEDMVIRALWQSGLKYLGGGLGRGFAKTRYGEEMTGQYETYHHIIKNRKAEDQLRGMVFRNAPVVIVVHGYRTNYLAHANGAIAMRNMEIMAQTRGLGTCWVGFLVSAAHSTAKIGQTLGVPADHRICGAIMLGYPKYRYKKWIPREERSVRWL